MEILALGPFLATVNDVSVLPRATKPRTLLALLAIYSERVVALDTIIEELWESSPPRSAVTIIQGYVRQIRQLIENPLRRTRCSAGQMDAKMVIKWDVTGYRLRRHDGRLDIEDHDHLIDAANHALNDSDLLLARSLLTDAQSLWRGAAFADIRAGSRIAAEVTRLRESHRTAVERRIELDLRLGRHHEILPELAALTAEQPSNESLRGHYAVALYRSGQRIRALAECDELRNHLAEAFGLHPSRSIAKLRQDILTNDSALEIPSIGGFLEFPIRSETRRITLAGS